MAGAPSATLQGWAMPALRTPQWDHTYVTSSCGLVGPWGCYGRSAGGAMLIAGTGSSAIADCLAQPNPDAAAIRYDFTGVCHQMANRILHPANVAVDNCRGYAVSFTLFDDYGRGAWLQRNACYPPGTIFAPGRHGAALSILGSGAPAVTADQATASTTGNQLVRGIVHLATVNDAVAAQEATEVARLSALAQRALGHHLEPGTLKNLKAVQSNLRDEQANLVKLFDAGRISADEYLARVECCRGCNAEKS